MLTEGTQQDIVFEVFKTAQFIQFPKGQKYTTRVPPITGSAEVARTWVGSFWFGILLEGTRYVCLDVDTKDQEVIDLLKGLGLPKTYTEETTRGIHFWYLLPELGQRERYQQRTVLVDAPRQISVEMKCAKGHVVVGYPLHRESATEIANAPDWVVERVRSVPREQPTYTPIRLVPGTELFAEEYDLARESLSVIPADDYHLWIHIGMILHDAFGDHGFELWDQWSRKSEKYDFKVLQKKWESFRSSGTKGYQDFTPLTIATLHYYARMYARDLRRSSQPTAQYPESPQRQDHVDGDGKPQKQTRARLRSSSGGRSRGDASQRSQGESHESPDGELDPNLEGKFYQNFPKFQQFLDSIRCRVYYDEFHHTFVYVGPPFPGSVKTNKVYKKITPKAGEIVVDDADSVVAWLRVQFDDYRRVLKQVERISIPLDLFESLLLCAARQNIINPPVDFFWGLLQDALQSPKSLKHEFKVLREYLNCFQLYHQEEADIILRWLAGVFVRVLYLDRQIWQRFVEMLPEDMTVSYFLKTMIPQNFVLYMIGQQGIGKSSAMRWLCDGTPYLAGSFQEGCFILGDRDSTLYGMGTIIWEISENLIVHGMNGRGGTMWDFWKSVVTQGTTKFRLPYARRPITAKVVTSYVVTTNRENIFEDETGNRRFYPISIRSIDGRYQRLDPMALWAGVAWVIRNNPLVWQLTTQEAKVRDARVLEFWADPDIQQVLQEVLVPKEGGFVPYRDLVRVLETRGIPTGKRSISKIVEALLGYPYTRKTITIGGKQVSLVGNSGCELSVTNTPESPYRDRYAY